MSEKRLVVVDKTQIQSYIFGSNRLRDNVGASHLVAQATGKWVKEQIERYAGEEIYLGGGNAVAIFDEEDSFNRFIRELSLKVLREAPGLRLIIISQPYEDSLFRQCLDKAFRQLAKDKLRLPISAPLLGLSVTRSCGATGLPAVGLTPKINEDLSSVYPVAAEILAKASANQAAKDRLKSYLQPKEGYDYPSDLDEMGRAKGEESYIAIVHIDGNGMGERFKAIGDKQILRRMSDTVNEASRRALLLMLNQLQGSIVQGELHHKDDDGRILSRVGLARTDDKGKQVNTDEAGTWKLPFRPVVFGGDDVTFVCDGRIGLEMAVAYLKAFENETKTMPDGKGRVTSCAGVAIVKTHFPFSRAYELAVALCRSAKEFRRKLMQDERGDTSCLDWHFTTGGLFGTLEEIREREYEVKQDLLYLRPVTTATNLDMLRCWDVVKRGIQIFQGSEWEERRNKSKALRDALREGKQAVERFRTHFLEGKDLPEVAFSKEEGRKDGWITDSLTEGTRQRCLYFDSLELSDRYIQLVSAHGKETK